MSDATQETATTAGGGAFGSAADHLFAQVARLVDEAQRVASRQVNATLVMRNWHVGRLISDAILGDERAAYGRAIVATLSRQLTERYGRGFTTGSLYRMVQFARQFPDEQILATASRELGWSHVVLLLPLASDDARRFYTTQVAEHHLSVAELRGIIDRKAYERREIANAQVASGSAVPVDSFRDPYLLDFLGLDETFQERDLEEAIVREIQPFLMEAGNGWSFVARQKRMVIDDEDFYLDLLFFSRPLRRLVAVELKVGKFKAAHKGQMELYLRWLDRYERRQGEEAPIGLILCTQASREQIELLATHKDGIAVAEYWTDLLPKDKLAARLGTILRDARERLTRRQIDPRTEPRVG